MRTFTLFIRTGIFLVLSLMGTQLFAQVTVSPARNTGIYFPGETVTFQLNSNSNGQATYTIKYDNFAVPIETGSVYIIRNGNSTISVPVTETGAIICEVIQNGVKGVGGALINPFDILPFEQEPADFDAFWNNQKAQLASVPVNPQVTFYQDRTYSTSYRISLGHIDNRRVYGYISVPKGTSGPYPGVVTVPAFGNVAGAIQPVWELAEYANCLSIAISIHNVPPDQVDPNGYEPDDIYNREGYYYRYAALAVIRAIDYLYTRNDFNGSEVALVGVSQGAGLSSLVSGIDQRVDLLALSNAALGQHGGLARERASGFPYYIHNARSALASPAQQAQVLDASRYYDAMFAAKRFRGPVFFNVSYADVITPAATQYAILNQFRGPVIHLHNVLGDHGDNSSQYFNVRFDMLRRYFSNTLNPPFPFAGSNTGFAPEAGPDRTIAGNTTTLNGSLRINATANPALPVLWEKISGPGNVSFGSPTSYNTSASFSSSGTYVLRMKVEDRGLINSERKFYSLMDYVTITVGSGGGDTQRPTVTLSTPNTSVAGPFLVNINFNESVTGLSINDFTVNNLNLSALSGSGSSYNLQATPNSTGPASIQLGAGRVSDLSGNSNTASNTLNITVQDQGGGGGGGQADLEISLTANKTSFSAFENIIYTLSVSNTGAVEASGVVIAYPISAGQAFVSQTETKGSYANWTGQWEVGSLPSGATETLELTLFTTQGTNPLVNFAQVISSSPDADSSPNNNSGTNPVEDDEAALTINPGGGSGGGGGGGNTDLTPPAVSLSTPSTSVTGPFVVSIEFTEPVTGLTTSDLVISNASLSNPAGGGANYQITLTPISSGTVQISIPAGVCNDDAGNANTASNLLSVSFDPGGGGSGGGGGTTPGVYCNVNGSAPWQQWIERVTFADLSNTSQKEGYGDFSSLKANVNTGESYAINITPGYSYAQYDMYCRVWIDYNNDNDFSDAGELVLEGINPAGPALSAVNGVSGQVSIPTDLPTGELRMRVSMNRNAYVDPCGTITNGEYEDYTVSVTSGGTGGGGGGGTSPDAPANYCDSRGNRPWQQWIAIVELEDIFNNSFKDRYGDFTNQSTQVSTGSTYTLSVTPGYSGERFQEYFRAWIDFNRDGDFDDAGELVLADQSNFTVTSTIQIPANASLGQTRLRISMQKSAPPASCGNLSEGEVEDYIVDIRSSGNSFSSNPWGEAAQEISLWPNPVEDELNLKLPEGWKDVTLRLVHPNGQVFLVEKVSETYRNNERINLGLLPAGTYWLQIDSKDRPRVNQKIVKIRD